MNGQILHPILYTETFKLAKHGTVFVRIFTQKNPLILNLTKKLCWVRAEAPLCCFMFFREFLSRRWNKQSGEKTQHYLKNQINTPIQNGWTDLKYWFLFRNFSIPCCNFQN